MFGAPEKKKTKQQTLTTLGLKGGVIFLWINLSQSTCLAKNGCALISSAPLLPNRRDGSLNSKPVMIERASEGMSSGKRRGSCKMRWYIVLTFWVGGAR